MKKRFTVVLVSLLAVSALAFAGCEAGLSQNDAVGNDHGFSFSDIYANIFNLQSDVKDLRTLVIPVGSITPFGGSKDKVPGGWLFCDGSSVSRSEYSALFDVIATSWGVGNGSSTFNLPDLRGMFLRGVSDGSGVDPDSGLRTNPNGGNSGDAVGSYQDDEFKEHSHDYWDIWHSEVGGVSLATNAGCGSTDYDNGQHQIKRTSDAMGDPETRPKNAAVSYIIKYQ
ncbi:MAG: tail fiber protein [bacterium]|nr:tail fiber protein [bacterium]